MDFCISRIEHFKASDCSGVYRESSRNLPNYPHSEVHSELTSENVCLCSILNANENIVEQIKSLKEDNAIKGRFNVNASNPRNMTNIMSQCFFKLTSGYVDGLSKDEIVNAYSDCLEFFKARYPSIMILSAYIHFDEPSAGPHMHVNFLPIHDDGERKIFSSSKVFEGKDHYEKYQDCVHSWATEHFGFAFSRRKPGTDKAKHLSVPEYKKAMRELEAIENRLVSYKPAMMTLEEIEQAGSPALFGGYKIAEEDLQELKKAATANIQSHFVIRRMEEERNDYRKRLEKEREISNRLARENRLQKEQLSRFKAWFTQTKMFAVYEKILNYRNEQPRKIYKDFEKNER